MSMAMAKSRRGASPFGSGPGARELGLGSRRGGIFGASLLCAAFLAGTVVLAWMLYLPQWVERWVEERTGFPVSIGFLGCNPLGFLLVVEEASIGSSEAFAERGFMEIASVRWEMEPSSLAGPVAVTREAEVRLKRLVVGIDETGRSNLERFFEALDLPKMRIRRARLVVDEVTIADDSGLLPRRRAYPANIDATLEDLSSPAQLFEPVAVDAVRLGFPRLLGEEGEGGARRSRGENGLDVGWNLVESALLR